MIECFGSAEVEYVFPIRTSPWVICTSACAHHELKRDTVALAAASIRLKSKVSETPYFLFATCSLRDCLSSTFVITRPLCFPTL